MQSVVHNKPYGPNDHGRIRTITVEGDTVHHWALPYTETACMDAQPSRRTPSRSRLSKWEKLAIERGGSVMDIKKEKP